MYMYFVDFSVKSFCYCWLVQQVRVNNISANDLLWNIYLYDTGNIATDVKFWVIVWSNEHSIGLITY